MIITLVEALLVFFAFGVRWFLNFLVTSFVYITTKDKRYNSASLILLVYLNFWIFGNIVDLFNNFNLMVLIIVLATEAVMYCLCYAMVFLMALFSSSQTNFVNYPAAFIFSLLTVPTINVVLYFIHNLIGFIIVA